jgi:hypothetical protein
MMLLGGRAGAAIALAQDAQARPSGMSEQDLSIPIAVAKASASRDPAEMGSVMASLSRTAHESAWHAVDAIQYAAALGRVDEAFSIADAYFFSRDFTVPDETPSADRAIDVTLDARDTRFLFLPSVRAMRADARFERLVDEIGLARYWREADAEPDYRKG